METATNKLEILRHSVSHVLAMAVLEMFPEAKFAIGPAIEDGFYYDFDLPRTLIPEDLPLLEEKMREIIKANHSFEHSTVSAEKAVMLFEKADQPYKVEIIKDLGEKSQVSLYKSGPFVDLCSGPHLDSTGEINPEAFKLLSIAGAYWKGNEKNKMLQRVYGTAFAAEKDLREYLEMKAEAEKRDHRKLAKELDLFMISEEVGKGLPLWLPKGAYVRKKLEDYMYAEELKRGYSFVYTPVLAHEELYKKSGHLAHYHEDMYNPIDIEGEKYYLKPMNCPHHHMMFKNKTMSYRDLPLRLSHFSPIHRFERSGVLTGLIRARCFSQNDAHIYCAGIGQLKEEFLSVMELFRQVYKDFDIAGYWFRLSLPDFDDPEKYGDIKDKETWEEATRLIKEAMDEAKMEYEEAIGEAAFYGPKIDVQIKNVHGKEDTIATAQVDLYSSKRFDLSFIDKDGQEKRPVILHRAIMGSFDRFFAFLVEKYAGAFPLWLAPMQVRILPISDKHLEYADKIKKELESNHFLTEVDDSNETIGKKIRAGELQKIPYLLIVGDKEEKSGQVAVRQRRQGDLGAMGTKEIAKKMKKEIEEKIIF